MQPVGFFLRALGAVIDVLASVVLLIVFWIVAGWVTGLGPEVVTLSPILTIATLAIVLVGLPTAIPFRTNQGHENHGPTNIMANKGQTGRTAMCASPPGTGSSAMR